jgi:hypothetical protein
MTVAPLEFLRQSVEPSDTAKATLAVAVSDDCCRYPQQLSGYLPAANSQLMAKAL